MRRLLSAAKEPPKQARGAVRRGEKGFLSLGTCKAKPEGKDRSRAESSWGLGAPQRPSV